MYNLKFLKQNAEVLPFVPKRFSGFRRSALRHLCWLMTATMVSTPKIHAEGHPGNPAGMDRSDLQEVMKGMDGRYFIENKGQWPQEVLFLARLGGLEAWITRSGVTYDFYTINKSEKANTEANSKSKWAIDKPQEILGERLGHVVKVNHIGANHQTSGYGKDKKQGYYNYFQGNDPSRWATEVGLYGEAVVKDIYSGVDMRWYFDKNNLRFDYIVSPGSDYRQIRMGIEGAKQSVVREGSLYFTTRFGEVGLMELFVYQETDKGRIPVKAQWYHKGEGVGFLLDNYDPKLPLIIDPVVFAPEYSTFLINSGNVAPFDFAVDASGSVYVTGGTMNYHFPTTPGAYDNTYHISLEAFVTKLNSTGTSLIYSTFIGGFSDDFSYAIAVDGSGNAYISGYTAEHPVPFPTTAGCFDNSHNGGLFDAFVTKLNPTGTNLVYSTFIGGNDFDLAYDLALDAYNAVYITGITKSENYPTTAGAYSSYFSDYFNKDNCFVTKLSPDGGYLQYSTALGGEGAEAAYAIAVDPYGNAYVAGGVEVVYSNPDDYSWGVDFPITKIFGNIYNYYGYGGINELTQAGFVTKLNASGSAIVYSICVGSVSYTKAFDVFVDNNGFAYVAGTTNDQNFYTTPGVYQTTGIGTSGFVFKLNTNGTAMVYSTYLSGGDSDEARSIFVDGSGNAYVTGFFYPYSGFIPPTPGALNVPGTNLYMAMLNPTGSGLEYLTYTGVPNIPWGISYYPIPNVAMDASGSLYLAGNTSASFPTTVGAFNSTPYYGSLHTFILKLSQCGSPVTYYKDADGDGYGDPAIFHLSCTPLSGYVSNNTDCNDANASLNPSTVWYLDADNDGYWTGSGVTQCTSPGTGYKVAGLTGSGDCNDGNASIHPGAAENFCNGLDDNCNGTTDEGAPAVTSLQPSNCGAVATSATQVFRAVSMAGATQYEFEFFDGVNTFCELRPNRGFYFSLWSWDLPSTTYQVRVRWFNGSVWSCWGPVCSVTNAPIATTQLDASSCGVTATSPAHVLYALSMPGATQYEFEFSDGVNTYYELRPNRGFYFSLFTWDQFSTTYTVKVRWYDGLTWSPWGPPCNVTTSPMPTTQLQPGDCGATVTSATQVLRANSMAGADQYEFKLSNGINTWYLLRPNRGTYLLLFGAGPWPAGSYTMEVRWRDAGTMTWSAWGPSCGLTLPMALDAEAEGVTEEWFDVKAFPVPFGDVVNLTVETFSAEPVHVTVMDVNGRVVEDRRVQMEHNGLMTLGESWANGVYMIRVRQGATQESIRVIKSN